MGAKIQKAHCDGLRGKLLAYYAANPGEELTPADIADKFGVPAGTVRNTLSRMTGKGEVRRFSVYRASLPTSKE